MTGDEIRRLLIGDAAFTPPLQILADLPARLRTLRFPPVPHSIAEELWHIVYWQRHFLSWARRERLPYPAHAHPGWRRIDSLSDSDYFTRQDRLAERASTLEEPGSDPGPVSLLELLANLAVHNAYHLGRIVLLRQMAESWPPPGGGDTW